MVTSRHPAVLLGGLLGAAVVLGYAGAALSAAARAAKASAAEVERQLRGFPRRDKVIEIPEDYTPSYRAVVDQSSRAAVERLFAPVGIALATPAVLGIGLRLLYSSGDLAADALASFVVIASATGLATALATEGARVVLCAAHRANRPRGSYGGFEVSVTGHAVADLIGSSAAPAAHSVAKACALTALLILPLVT
jgi:K(+)-stimulated pyrophosphate-energized sodium pump